MKILNLFCSRYNLIELYPLSLSKYYWIINENELKKYLHATVTVDSISNKPFIRITSPYFVNKRKAIKSELEKIIKLAWGTRVLSINAVAL